MLGLTLVIPQAKRELAALVCILRDNPGAYFDGDIDVLNIWSSHKKTKLLFSVGLNPVNNLYEFKLDDAKPKAKPKLVSKHESNQHIEKAIPASADRLTCILHRIWHLGE